MSIRLENSTIIKLTLRLSEGTEAKFTFGYQLQGQIKRINLDRSILIVNQQFLNINKIII